MSPLRCAFRLPPTIVPLANKSFISITGSQAAQFLNGLLTTSVADPPQPFFSAFLNPQGRVINDVFAYTTVDEATGRAGYIVEHDKSTDLLSMLKRHVLRSKVKIRDVSDKYDSWAIFGSQDENKHDISRQWHFANSLCVEPVWPSAEWPWGTEQHVILDQRAPGMGKRRLLRKGDRPQEAGDHDLGSPDDFTLHRILRGVPEGPTDITPEHSFPMDSNLDIMGGVNFRKGCYVGQELTVRTYHTGVVRKRILPVMIHKTPETPPEVVPSSTIDPITTFPNIQPRVIRQPGDDRPIPRPRSAGKLLTNRCGLGLALLRLEHVAAAEKGATTLEINDDGKQMQITPWWPDWWPRST
ncbi:hypothetical protein ONZ45_g11753 [Pleurotus djamor]|nr:hypothetical protein ONZ45_g11753 [Pleurotus djamor]